MGLQLKSKPSFDHYKVNKTDNKKICPICNSIVEGQLLKHIQDFHDTNILKDLIIRDFDIGLTHIEIGKKYGVTLRYLEKIITDTKGVNISNFKSNPIKILNPRDFKEESTTVWSFKSRGSWASHSGEYRGNWSPYIPRNLILKYSLEDDLILDNFCGAGTTAIEAKLLHRHCIALDINKRAIEMARQNINRLNSSSGLLTSHLYVPELIVADARYMTMFKDNTFDLICSHPPYADIIKYTSNEKEDLSHFDKNRFLVEMRKVAQESFRVLKPGKKCAVLIGDMRKNRHVVPLGFDLIDVYLSSGFRLHEMIIKRQHNCKTTGFWYANSVNYNFLLLAHEYLPIFEKPNDKNCNSSANTNHLMSEVPNFNRDLNLSENSRLETTTVWIAKEQEFEKHILLNLIGRYGKCDDGFSYEILSLDEIRKTKQIQKKLIFINFCNPKHSVNNFVEDIEQLSNLISSLVFSSGYIAIYAQDVDVDDQVVPLAKMIVDSIKLPKLKLKEIIVAVKEDNNNHDILPKLKRVHGYILVYERK